MRNVIAVFNNRNQSMQFASYLQRLNVRCKTISTPRELSTSCGLSVVFLENGLPQARFLLNNYKIGSFAGFYIENDGMLKKYQRI